MPRSTTLVERFIIPHDAFRNATEQIEQAFKYAQNKGEGEALALIGESGTGKTSVLDAVRSRHESVSGADRDIIPILSATVPSEPTVKSLAAVLLAAIGDSRPEQGTEPELTRRLKSHIKATGTCMIMIDEFQHFYDRGRHKVMHKVADWLKELIDATKTTLVVAGLPYGTSVIDQNEQLARRFSASLSLPRFSWNDIEQREEFIRILHCYEKEISKHYKIPELSSESMAFRFYCATNGLMGYLSKLLKQLLRNAEMSGKESIILEDIAKAYMQSIWPGERIPGLPRPFSRNFELRCTSEVLQAVSRIGAAQDECAMDHRSRRQSTR